MPSTACDNFHNFQPIARLKITGLKFGWSDCFAVVFHHDAARQKILREQEFLD